MKVKCLHCEHEFVMSEIYNDDLGNFTVCPKCEGSFDVDVTFKEFMEDLRMEQQEQM